ncbi:TPA: hypothetical protein ACRNM6_000340 [Pseudomonas aeruginosa]|uniref:hypothetical protein n=1 Tax=Pseudomonas aeruginosa TaxID=287 RepID=UPI00094088CE|nr:hypothetical protein [Pseudomonas aeruginosa]ELH5365599.1 hypothetical protein [Pseudomonas aeruginosa]ELH5377288.1 hypothetical protein [Pseudomonas aeruginosa]MBH4166751.1 hypothetical protein [Pseudomonas aeruginosa]MBN5481876.1 hypothetical protein [Pseudomonas aeruginosa]MBV5856717.1 hypothetical protein [Pseudomonas aeruginosa]
MNDRTLLELAARAAGYAVDCGFADCPLIYGEDAGMDGPREWNPLTDDGDALRLAVDAGILDGNAFSVWLNYRNGAMAIEGLDAREATRLAFVRVAAEIGKSMGGGE